VESAVTAAVVLPRERLSGLVAAGPRPSGKLVGNCEQRLFRRPDDGIHRGFDPVAEADIARGGAFFSNYEPLTPDDARRLVDHVVEFDRFTTPMQQPPAEFARPPTTGSRVSSAPPRARAGPT